MKEEVETLERKAERAAGALDQLLARLQDEFGVKTVKEAEKLLARLEREEQKVQAEYEEALREFETKWGAKLEGG